MTSPSRCRWYGAARLLPGRPPPLEIVQFWCSAEDHQTRDLPTVPSRPLWRRQAGRVQSQSDDSLGWRLCRRCSYLEIYNEQVIDLLAPGQSTITIREDSKRGVYVEGATEETVTTPAATYAVGPRPSL